MTDKQIIIDKDKFEKAENEPINQEAVNKFMEDTNKFYIDGVDVSGCTQYDPDEVLNCNDYCLCKELPDCYYKLWKRKEQECEELKGTRDRNFLHALEEQKRADKFSKTLAEIKEIAEIKQKQSVFVMETVFEQILQKINEVEDVNNNR